jgi:hypothetical protein
VAKRIRVEGATVLVFDVVRPFGRAPRSRSSGGERPPHTRKVTGSIPVGTTTYGPRHNGSAPQVGAGLADKDAYVCRQPNSMMVRHAKTAAFRSSCGTRRRHTACYRRPLRDMGRGRSPLLHEPCHGQRGRDGYPGRDVVSGDRRSCSIPLSIRSSVNLSPNRADAIAAARVTGRSDGPLVVVPLVPSARCTAASS